MHKVYSPQDIERRLYADWEASQVFAPRAGATGEILIVDSSTDRTPEIVLAKGGRVLKVPNRGLGRAYIDGFKWASMPEIATESGESRTKPSSIDTRSGDLRIIQ